MTYKQIWSKYGNFNLFFYKTWRFLDFFSQKIICKSHILFFPCCQVEIFYHQKENNLNQIPYAPKISKKWKLFQISSLFATFNIVFIILGNMCFKIVRKAFKTFNFFSNFVQMFKVAQHALGHFEQFCQHLQSPNIRYPITQPRLLAYNYS